MNRSLLLLIILLFTGLRQAGAPVTVFDINYETLNGRVKQLIEYTDAKHWGADTIVTTFGANGRIVRQKNIGPCGCGFSFSYQLNAQGKKRVIIRRTTDRPAVWETTYSFDQDGHIAEMISPTKMEDVDDKYFSKYDDAGNRVQEDYFVGKEHRYVRTFRYDNHHQLLETKVFQHISVNDDPGPDTLDTRRVANYRIVYQYTTFDTHGNWIKRVATTHSNPAIYVSPKPAEGIETNIETRKISYY